jgi:hypothetical protein
VEIGVVFTAEVLRAGVLSLFRLPPLLYPLRGPHPPGHLHRFRLHRPRVLSRCGSSDHLYAILSMRLFAQV